MHAFQVTVFTSKLDGAAKSNNSSVYLTLHGSRGPPMTSTAASGTCSSVPGIEQQQQSINEAGDGRLLSSNRYELVTNVSGAFAEGGVASLQLPAMQNLGQLRHITLELQSDRQVHIPDRVYHRQNTAWVALSMLTGAPGGSHSMLKCLLSASVG